MRDLPDKRQTATYLRFVEEWTPREIAELLHCTPATARVHAHQGAKEISNVVAHPNEYAPLEYSPRGTRNVRYYRTAPGARAALLISVLAGAAMGMIWTWFVVWLLADHWASVWLWGLGTAAVAVLAWLGRRFLWPAVRRLQARCR
jgi:hypothetical protein